MVLSRSGKVHNLVVSERREVYDHVVIYVQSLLLSVNVIVVNLGGLASIASQ